VTTAKGFGDAKAPPMFGGAFAIFPGSIRPGGYIYVNRMIKLIRGKLGLYFNKF
jgi:hypothetical protein